MESSEGHFQRREARVVDADGAARVVIPIDLQCDFCLADSRTPAHIANRLNELAGSNSGMTFTCSDIPDHPSAVDGVRVYRIQTKYQGTANPSDVIDRFNQLVAVDLARADADLLLAERNARNV